jgi:hypothetical protein
MLRHPAAKPDSLLNGGRLYSLCFPWTGSYWERTSAIMFTSLARWRGFPKKAEENIPPDPLLTGCRLHARAGICR